MRHYVRAATLEDIKDLAPRLREADKAEIFASTGMTPEECLEFSLTLPSVGIWVGIYDGRPELIFGLTHSGDPDVGIPWMVATDEVTKNPKPFLQYCGMWIDGFSKQFPVLRNFVHAENAVHIRWLKRCGFEFVKLHEKHGYGQEPFWEFEMVKQDKE